MKENNSRHYLSSNLSGALRNCTTGCKLQITYIDKQLSYICKKSQYDFRPKLVVLSGTEKIIYLLEELIYGFLKDGHEKINFIFDRRTNLRFLRNWRQYQAPPIWPERSKDSWLKGLHNLKIKPLPVLNVAAFHFILSSYTWNFLQNFKIEVFFTPHVSTWLSLWCNL